MANKIYIFRTVTVGGRDRLNPMPFQTDEAGRSVITSLNVQSDMSMRRAYPVGTIFASETLENRDNGGTAFYAAGEIFPVSVDRKDLAAASHAPTEEMVKAFNDYMAANADKLNPQGSPNTGVFSEEATPGRPLSLLEKLQRNPKYEKPTVAKDGFYVEDDTWWDLMMNLVNNTNTLFKGPAGSGKTELVRLACERLGLPCHTYDMGSMYDPISDLLGVHRMTAQGSVFDYAQFTQDIQHEGVILLDELSRATPAVNNILMPCLDSRRTLRVEMAGAKDKREIPVHPKCRFVATANLGAEYAGTNEIDLALRDRFDEMDISYMPAEEETAMLVKRFRIPKADAQNIVNTAVTVRNIAAKGDLEFSITTRETIRAARKVADGWPAAKAMERAFLARYEGTRSEGSKAVVWNAILSR